MLISVDSVETVSKLLYIAHHTLMYVIGRVKL